MGPLSLTLGVLFLTLSPPAFARPVQIIHTNDLHSYFERGDTEHTGGYAAVKGVIESIRARAAAQGIETLLVDAGDFSEGTAFFLADAGRESWRALDAMGYDAVTLGNHDWLIGSPQMDAIVASVRPRTPLLAANVDLWNRVPNLDRHLHPFVETVRGGIRIAILGLSTDERLYSWRTQDGRITPPLEAARALIPELRLRNDHVIVLSHLGYERDRKLARRVPGIDLIIGGHSHTPLKAPVYRADVPIVQANPHGETVGDLLVDLEPGKALKILSYQLVPVLRDGPRDAAMETFVTRVREQLEKRFSKEWLYEIIGHSQVPVERPLTGPTAWGQLAADSLREAAQADLAVDVGEFYGTEQPEGPVTRETLMQFYPRVFDINNSSGWTVWSIQVPGWLLRTALNTALREGQFLITSGVTYRVGTDEEGRPRARSVRVNGKKLDDLRDYTVAVSEGIGRGSLEISALLRLLFEPRDTGVPMWTALEARIRSQGGVIGNRAPASLP
ncbi:MAG: bifunctional metallophosphatase/5'-nucleotidase [Oligoflexia bacterium]|nr:bifunctional metallophosphatase/5'-nucleotidase [Oligoflexia bacterium]